MVRSILTITMCVIRGQELNLTKVMHDALYNIEDADDMCTCMFVYVCLVMKKHIECHKTFVFQDL